MHQPTLIDNASVQLRLVRDGRAGVATTNRTDDEGLAELARRATEVVGEREPGPGAPAARPARRVPGRCDGYDEETAALGADDQARLAAAAIAASGDYGLYGYFTSGVVELAIASTHRPARIAADDRRELARPGRGRRRIRLRDPHLVASRRRGSGRGCRGGGREGRADAQRAGGAAPRQYRAVLEPYAIAELLYYFAFDTFNGLALLEERSYFAGRIGERAFDPKVTLADDALDPGNLPTQFDFEGTPKQRVTLVEEGVIRDAVWDRATAARAGRGVDRPRAADGLARVRRDCDRDLDGAAARPGRPTSWRSSSATASTSRACTTSASSTRARA